MKKAVLIVSTLLCSISAFAFFSSKKSEPITDNEIDILKNSIIVDSLSMNSDNSPSEGYIIHDDSFIISESINASDGNKKSISVNDKKSSDKTGNEYLKELKKNNIRWHLVKHIIRKNENLISIAEKYNSDISHIARYNGIKNTDLIKKGSNILIPTQDGIEYKVKSGDNISKIAKKYNISKKDIINSNRIDSDMIKAGQCIFLPSAKEEISQSLYTKSDKNKRSQDKKIFNAKSNRTILKDEYTESSKAVIKQYSFLMPAKGKITSSFGIRRNPFNGKREFHNGVDIGCPIGTPIKSSADGKVIFSGSKDGYGNMIVIEHADKMITVYAHLDSMQKNIGDDVKRGETIALSGATGTVTGPHLHFEIRKNYVTALNPMRIIRK
ncbi:MAG: M23 family metallopeptidase [Spirochaetes bacterium]|nr:M23 family metallopeptidase [Spirochaetota bacterium]